MLRSSQPRTMLENIDILHEDEEEDEEAGIAGVESASSGSKDRDRNYRSSLSRASIQDRPGCADASGREVPNRELHVADARLSGFCSEDWGIRRGQ